MKQMSARAMACLALSTLPLAPCGAAGLPTPPVAEVRDVATVLHGTTVHDPYRWMEDVKSAQVQAWMQAQGQVARQVLDRIEGREAIAARIKALDDAQGDSIRSVTVMPGDRWYYLKRTRGEAQFKLVMRQGVDGAERVLVDPQRETARTGVPHAINYYRPSWDGKHVAYGVSAGGSEDASLFVLKLSNNKLVGKPVPRVQESLLHWLPDSQSLTLNQFAKAAKGAPETDFYKNSRVLWLKLATPGSLLPVFGPTVTRGLGLGPLDVAELITVPGSRWVVARTTDTTVPEGKLFVAPLASFGKASAKWVRIADEADKVYAAALRADNLFLMTQRDTPRRKIVAVDLHAPSLAKARLVAAEPADGALEGFSVTPSAVMAEKRIGTSVVLRRYAEGDTVGRDVAAPTSGTAWLAATPAHDREELPYVFNSWSEPARWYLLQGEKSVTFTLGLREVPPGLPELQVTEVIVPSHDGVGVPLTVLHKKGLALEGNNPVLLHGYASYGFSESAYFSTGNMAWIEQGGVLAFSNPRGSGVYGDAWHRAGFKTTKSNTWKDGIACARWLVQQGYGSPKTMAIMGTSAGGIFVGRAATEAPELFAAAIFNVGMLDVVRSEESANGATNISEFGTVKDPAEAKALIEMSTYHAIEGGKRYPSTLLIHGLNDPRVDTWNSSKTAARLQAAQTGVPDAGVALLRLDAQAGHGVGSTLTQWQAVSTDIQSFLLWQMGKLRLRD
jgi:prolyl oligopeptidase